MIFLFLSSFTRCCHPIAIITVPHTYGPKIRESKNIKLYTKIA